MEEFFTACLNIIEIDLFASWLNAQLLRFFLYRPDPFEKVTNAFSLLWEDKKFCFPPFACVDKILQKISADKCNWIYSGAKLAKTDLVPILNEDAYWWTFYYSS